MLSLSMIIVGGIFIFLSVILYLAGIIMALIGGIKMIIAAFRCSFLWGMGYLLVPFVSLIFLLLHWEDAKEGFFLNLKGFGLILLATIGFYFSCSLMPENFQNQFMTSFKVAHSKMDDQKKAAQSKALQTAHEDVQFAKEQVAALETKLNQSYPLLAEKRKNLDLKNQTAVHAFNIEAAEYSADKTRLAEQTKELTRLKKQEEFLQIQAGADKNENSASQ